MSERGYSKIISATPQVDMGLVPCGDGLYTETSVFEILWLETQDGIFSVQVRHGESAETLAQCYRARGWTDARCTFFRAR